MSAQPPNQVDSTNGAADLWKRAFEALYLEEQSLVLAYQSLILEDDPTDSSAKADDNVCVTGTFAIDMHLKLDKEEISHFLTKKIGTSKQVTIDFEKQIDRIISGIVCVKDFIGSVPGLEPHAAMAWAGACVVSQLILATRKQSTAAMDGLGCINKSHSLSYMYIKLGYEPVDPRHNTIRTAIKHKHTGQKCMDNVNLTGYPRLYESQLLILC
ncbi:hypothetical protein GGI43DRAFT_429063 [Trichoderma evansii]